jgi:hypothetical protein
MMFARYLGTLGLCAALVGGHLVAADVEPARGPTAAESESELLTQAPKKGEAPKKKGDAPPPKKKDVAPAPKKKDDAPPADALAQAQAERPDYTSLPRIRSPQFLGDFLGGYVQRALTIQPTVTFHTVINNSFPAAPVTRNILVPDVFLGALKIAENESPRPEDRVFLDCNYYANVRIPVENGGGFAFAVAPFGRVLTGSGQLAVTGLDVHRDVIGFEKTFLGGDASIGLRLPFIVGVGGNAGLQSVQAPFSRDPGLITATASVSGDPGVRGGQVGDLSLILKYALLNDCNTGNVISTGLLVTVPTGNDLTAADGSTVNPTYVQPFVGFVWNTDKLYVHGFSSLAVPTQSSDVTFLFNDLGVGYWLYRDAESRGLLKGLVPTLELHVNTPLSHRDGFQPAPGLGPTIGEDLLDLTAGIHGVFHRNSTLTLGACVPVTGPRPNDFEIIAQLNLRF